MFKRNPGDDQTLTLLIACLIWVAGAYLLIHDYIKTGLLNGPMAVVLIIGIGLTLLAFFRRRHK